MSTGTSVSVTEDVNVRIEDRIRLMSAVLAATDFPEKAQQRKPHGTHAHARATRKYLANHTEHPAVKSTQALLDQGTPLEALFTLVMLMQWPELTISNMPRWVPAGYNVHLKDFYEQTRLASWWQAEATVWEKARKEAANIFADMHFKEFLKPFLGDINETLVFVPNIGDPTDLDLGLRLGDTLYCVAPPPLAWGESPPWPYDEDTVKTHSYQVAMSTFGRILLLHYLRSHGDQLAEVTRNELPVSDQFKATHPSWEDQFSTLFVMACSAMYFEKYVDEAEYKAYVLMQKKAHGMALLPGTVSVLRRYLGEVGGKYKNFFEFLPYFPRQLRVAQKIIVL